MTQASAHQGATDLEPVWGADAIGRAIGRNKRQAHHLLNKGAIPARKIGGRWVADRGELARFLRGEVSA